MKNIKKNFLLIVALLFAFQIQAQEIEIVEDEFEIEDTEIVVEKKKVNNKYKTYKINDIYDLYYDKYSDSYYKNYGILKNGKKLLPNIFRKEGYNYSSGLIVLGINGVYGLYSVHKEAWAIPMLYQNLSELKNGLYKAKVNGKWGIVDENNTVIVDFIYAEMSKFYYIDNYFKVSLQKYPREKYGVLNIVTKKMNIPCKYKKIEAIRNTNYFKVQDGVKYNLVDINNSPKFKTWYEKLYMPKGGRKLYIVMLNGKMGVIDENENQVVPIEYEEIKSEPYKDGSYLARNKEGKYGCITLDGRVTLQFIYNNVEKKYNNSIIALHNDKCGLVQVNDGMPYEVATCDYNSIVGENKIFIVEKDNKFGMLDLYGKLITKIEYDKIEASSSSYYGNNKPFIAKKGNNYYLLNSSGELVSNTAFKSIEKLSEYDKKGSSKSEFSFFIVRTSKKGKYGLIDLFGKEVLSPEFDNIISKKVNVVIVEKDSKVGLYDIIKNKMILKVEYDQIILSKTGFVGMKDNDFYQIDVKDKLIVKKF
ncbi:MAG: WG repeat-containing protein [Bacteroidota bacterium]